MRGQEVLRYWQNKYNGTYRALCEAALKMEENTMAKWICRLGKGDWSSVCPTDDSSDGDRLPVQSTGVETTPSQPTTDVRGQEKQVVSGLRQRRIGIPDQLNNVISELYNIKAQSYSNQSTISQLKNECSDLQTKLQIAIKDLELAKERLNDKGEELSKLRYQNHMLEQSQVEGMESRVEYLIATSKQTNEELREKISKFEQGKLFLVDEFETQCLEYEKKRAFEELLQLKDEKVVEREEYRSHVTELQSIIAAKEVEVHSLRRKCEECEKLIQSQSEQIVSLRALSRTDSLEQKLARQAQGVVELEDCKAEAETNLKEKNSELEKLTDERDKSIQSYYESADVANEQIAECEKKIESLIGQLLKKEEKCSKLKQKVRRLQIMQTLIEQIYNADHRNGICCFVYSVFILWFVSCLLIFLVFAYSLWT